jgi:hypothetical protein
MNKSAKEPFVIKKTASVSIAPIIEERSSD